MKKNKKWIKSKNSKEWICDICGECGDPKCCKKQPMFHENIKLSNYKNCSDIEARCSKCLDR